MFNIKPPKDTRHFYDPDVTKNWLLDNARKSFDNKLNKIESADYKLNVTDVCYQDPDKHFSLAEQKDALLSKKDLVHTLKGTFELIDKKTNKVLDSKRTIIAQIPHITQRNTNILNGSEYIVINQQRLKPGVYTRIKETGEAEAHINIKAGTGLSGKIVFHPETALFIYEFGTAQIKLYGLLHALGASDSAMEKAWGKEIFMKNKLAHGGDEISKFYNRIFTFK
jgi:DNA-directed RNA polymerase beta subunit